MTAARQTPVALREHIHALRTLIEYREHMGPRVYIAKDLDAALRALLAWLAGER
jgi:hypothetical protein